MEYTKETMPFKLVLSNKYGEHTFYKSVTEYLSYNEQAFDVQVLQRGERKSGRRREYTKPMFQVRGEILKIKKRYE